jgi:hypothetical protein
MINGAVVVQVFFIVCYFKVQRSCNLAKCIHHKIIIMVVGLTAIFVKLVNVIAGYSVLTGCSHP